VPNDLARRLDHLSDNLEMKLIARTIGNVYLDGRQPEWFLCRPSKLREIVEHFEGGWPEPVVRQALQLLKDADYGVPWADRPRRPRRERDHGAVQSSRLDGVLGQLPRSLALRYPTTDDRHARGRYDGQDVYGRVRCNHTPRAGHLGFYAAAGGLWMKYGDGSKTYVDVTRGDLLYLLVTGRRDKRRSGGEDYKWLDGIIRDVVAEQITATVEGADASDQHRIPSSACTGVDCYVDGEFVDHRQLDGESLRGRTGQDATIRIHLADWFIAELRHGKRRSTFINFAVWRGLQPTGRRLYAYLQGATRHPDGSRRFYLAKPLRFTLGLRGSEPHKAAAAVRFHLNELYHVDERYHAARPGAASGFRQIVQPGTADDAKTGRRRGEGPLASFLVYAHGQQSRPTMRCKTGGRPTPRRPLTARGRRTRAHVSPYDVPPQEVPGFERRRAGGFEQARAEIADRRERVANYKISAEDAQRLRHQQLALDARQVADVDAALRHSPHGGADAIANPDRPPPRRPRPGPAP
jgi:hypothetical protein